MLKRKLLNITLSVAAAVFLTQLATSSPAGAIAYDREAALAYANTYSCNTGYCRNSYYWDFGGTDCTNFVSQAVYAGGQAMRSTSPYWNYVNNPVYGYLDTYSTSWVNVAAFKQFFVNATGRAVILAADKTAAYNPSSIGDVYMYDWGKGEGYSHLGFASGAGLYSTFTDPATGIAYSDINGGRGDWNNQHSTDRKRAPWNWGYQTEPNQIYRSNSKIVIIHFVN